MFRSTLEQYTVECDSVVRSVAEALWAYVLHVAPHTVEGVDWAGFDWQVIASITFSA